MGQTSWCMPVIKLCGRLMQDCEFTVCLDYRVSFKANLGNLVRLFLKIKENIMNQRDIRWEGMWKVLYGGKEGGI